MQPIDPAQKPRLLAIEANTIERLDEARSMKWLDEVNAHEESLRHIRAQRDQPDRTEHETATGERNGPVETSPGLGHSQGVGADA